MWGIINQYFVAISLVEMKNVILFISLFFSLIVVAQNEQLAQYYFDKGDFEKALLAYETLLENQPSNTLYFNQEISCLQQLERYNDAENKIQKRLDKYKQSSLLIELGYNFQLQKQENKAIKYYDQAIEKIKKSPIEVYGVAAIFEKKSLIDYALKSYEIAISLQPEFNFNFQMALLYGQKGQTDLMIEKFLEESYINQGNLLAIQNQLSRFMTENESAAFCDMLKKALLIRVQKNQDVFWNQYLSWFFVQQKEYGKAFIQEKAIFKRNPETLNNIVNLAQLAIEQKENNTAKEILNFILENTQNIDLKIQANYYLIEMKINQATPKEYNMIENEFSMLLKQFGISPYSLSLQILNAHFTAFSLKKPEVAKLALKNALELPLNNYQVADIKMELADILLFEEKFNQALIYYSQIEEDLKNDVVGHEASLKVAKTSYFKGDFDWAQKQFKELKSASTQLIANDALEYFLLINDNTVADSTQTALKLFAKADFLLYQNKMPEALQAFENILKQYKGKEIESITLLRMGETNKKLNNFNLALQYFQQIIDRHKEGIYIDEALYLSADIYETIVNDAEKAKVLFEKIVFDHQDSIYYVESRRRFRQLRGDKNL